MAILPKEAGPASPAANTLAVLGPAIAKLYRKEKKNNQN